MARPTPYRPTWLDRAIAHFDPIRGVRRARARLGLEFYAGTVERASGSYKGTNSNWRTRQISHYAEAQERQTTNLRAQDLAANDAYAASLLDSLSLNVVGKGLAPQSRPRWDLLGISEDQARDVARQAEWWWGVWSRQADAGERMNFNDMQFLATYSMLCRGEYLVLPLEIEAPGRDFSLAFQVLDPLRLRTPSDRVGAKMVHDGLELGDRGQVRSYFIADPGDGLITPSLSSTSFRQVPARRGHRPGMLHGFYAREPEQKRGVSVLAPAMKLIKDTGEYLDYELAAAILTASMPIAVTLGSNPIDFAGGLPAHPNDDAAKKVYHQEIAPGQFAYFNQGEDVKPLDPKRPSGTAEVFIRTMLRAISASTGLPYEIVAKDFSQTNYSSGRMALLEAWRLYTLYRSWLVQHLCGPVWRMFFEEAVLRGHVTLPRQAPGFYDAFWAWTHCAWSNPPRGHVDPVKEMQGDILAMKALIKSHGQVVAEQGQDSEETLDEIARERAYMAQKGLAQDLGSEPTNSQTADPPADQQQEG